MVEVGVALQHCAFIEFMREIKVVRFPGFSSEQGWLEFINSALEL